MGPYPVHTTQRTMARRFRAMSVPGEGSVPTSWFVYDHARGCSLTEAEDREDAKAKAALAEAEIGACRRARNSIHQVQKPTDPTDPKGDCVLCGKSIDLEFLELVEIEG